jgi:hypothetical protein
MPCPALRRHGIHAAIDSKVGDATLDSVGAGFGVPIFKACQPEYLHRGAHIAKHKLSHRSQIDTALLCLKVQKQEGLWKHGDRWQAIWVIELERHAEHG